MQATQKTLTAFLRERQQLRIPLYQRTYSWEIKQCEKLWDDIMRIADKEDVDSYFIGSIVRIKKNLDTREISEQIIIDGQQRITTILLLLSALAESTNQEESAEEWKEEYLINKGAEGELRYKLILTEEDKSSLIAIIEKRIHANIASTRIKENFEFFKEKLFQEKSSQENTEDALQKIYAGIKKLAIVDITLGKHDNPQLIFESLNSKGLDLSQADLIRNYVLIDLHQELENTVYSGYWRPMEKNFGQKNYGIFFNRFMRDYLTMKTGRIPNEKNVYEEFKKYYEQQGGKEKAESILDDVYKHSVYYVNMALKKEKNVKLQEAFSDLKALEAKVVYPFLLSVYRDYDEEIINEECFLDILNLTQSYIFRRSVCGLPSNSHGKFFAGIYKSIKKENYFESLQAKFNSLRAQQRFPNNKEFKEELGRRNLYHTRNIKFLLRRLENFGRKEPVNTERYTIEHIMPQNQNLSGDWQAMLGENWKAIQEQYLHTLGNLTLTGYNSELSDKLFADKKSMEGGFHDSPLRLNKSLREVTLWDEAAIKKREKLLAKKMLKIWPYPDLPEEVLEKYRPKQSENKPKQSGENAKPYTLEDRHPHIAEGGSMKELFEAFQSRVKSIDSSVEEVILKQTVAYKAPKNFVSVIPSSSIKLKIGLNMYYNERHDPKGICRDRTKKALMGVGDVEVCFSALEELDYIMMLVKQSFDKRSGG